MGFSPAKTQDLALSAVQNKDTENSKGNTKHNVIVVAMRLSGMTIEQHN